MKESKIYGIQILRVLACLGVIGVHLSLYVTLPIMIAKIWQFGSQGPYFFFILSGYLMMSSRDLEKGDWKKYYQNVFSGYCQHTMLFYLDIFSPM